MGRLWHYSIATVRAQARDDQRHLRALGPYNTASSGAETGQEAGLPALTPGRGGNGTCVTTPAASRWTPSGPRSEARSMLTPEGRAGWLVLAARLLLGGVWIVAGALKLPDPAGSVRAVRAYQLLPEAVVPAVGYGLPVLEVAVGVLLVLGVGVRLCAAVSVVLLAAFIVGVGSAWARGLTIDCGCFGGGGAVAAGETRYLSEVLRDGVLLFVAAALARWPNSRRALVPQSAPRQPSLKEG